MACREPGPFRNPPDGSVGRLLLRLHRELKDAVEKQLEALPLDSEVGDTICADEETVGNLREQLEAANQVSSRRPRTRRHQPVPVRMCD